MNTTLEIPVSNKPKKSSSSGTSCEMMPKLYVCYVCGERYSCNSSLKQHMNNHLKENNFKCDICSKAFRRNCTLKRHKMIHEKKQLFDCEICGKGFSRKDTLKYHMKGYSCTECARSFCRKYELRIHTRKQHVLTPKL